MSRTIISGASGDLGRRVTRLLLDEDPDRELILTTRTPEKLADLASDTVQIRHSDYAYPETVRQAYEGGDVLFLISGLNLGRRVSEHRGAIAAAQHAGVEHIVYTSVGGVQPGNPALSAIDHCQTEQDLRDSGIAYTFLRNALYAEIVSNILVAPAVPSGILSQATGDGYLAPVAKEDVARSAAACLMNPAAHAGRIYEITGPELLNFHQIAALASHVHSSPIEYTPVSEDDRLAFFDAVGIPRTYDPTMPPSPDGHLWASDELVSAEVAVAQGYQALQSRHVEQITGREPEPLATVMERVREVRYDKIEATVA
ncbi:SDR family oxidoreductase [Rhodococcus sp. BP-149]|uniref:SDR family oxidoreductase n=1 Tax=unclassified Rhodococcus (in: high G+C Gram-positive bacteria) TaxID=192944 RepID=UPI001C9B97D9|nr:MULTISPECIES: SDR family oxidoreductase [unclassified Rhodococcus (in: high G+C Gram-positive bacteria)]MBY6685617.1 SDR family oxidoreductase [Rhodococcus sp. BP-288]MBY6694835.1 SDR family oxidoreductase [Rhodococcus sp. BP-188]MBY6696681.1 SDR family oxidoreductase [Rhodococcus sp. BP-285]MBY6703337.1 SDR family oxidoreductase [Rhodococcus sp. BP-283]MBY6708660.1 SDR family oxidoreductase [Rhodococcus sp. BP-241]